MSGNKKTSPVFRILLYVFGIFLLLVLLGLLAAGFKYRQTMQNPENALVTVKPHYIPDHTLSLGETFTCALEARAPWGAKAEAPQVTPGEGVQLLDQPACTPDYFHWGYFVWKVSLPLQTYRSGETGKGSLKISFRLPDGNVTMFDLELPALTVNEQELKSGDTELTPAGMLEEEQKVTYLWKILCGVIGLILIIGIILVLKDFFRKQTQPRVKTVWETALESIQTLCIRVREGKETPEQAVALLTDIVRRFIETCYQLRAERQTTGEFLRELDRETSPLPEQSRKFLRRFLESADMVKFARMTADPLLFEDAAVRAGKLVEESRSAAETGKEA